MKKVKNQQNNASDEKNIQEEEEDFEEQEIEVNVPTINEALQAKEWCIIFMKQHQKMCNYYIVTRKCRISLQGSRHKLHISSM